MATMRHIATAQGCPIAHRSHGISDIDRNMLKSPTDSAPWEIHVPQKPSAPLIRLMNGGLTPEVESSAVVSPTNSVHDPRAESDEPTEAHCPLSKSRQPGTMLASGFRQMHCPNICSPEESTLNASFLGASTSTMALSVSPSAMGIAAGTHNGRSAFPPLDPSEHSTDKPRATAGKATATGQCPYRRMVVEVPKAQPAAAKPAAPEPTRIPFTPTGTVLAVPRGGYTLALVRSAIGLPQATGVVLFLALPLLRHVIPGLPHVSFASVLVTLLVAWFANYVRTNVAFWARHLHRDEEECRNSRNAATKPFLSRRVEVRDHHVVAGKSVFAPQVTADYVHRRAFATVGLTVRAYMRDLVTYALEYKIQAVWRLIAVDLGLGQYAAAPTGETLYRYVINTSVGCFIDAESGHVELYDTCLPYKTSGMKTWHKMVLELDHEAHRAVRLLVQETRAAEGERPVVLVLEDMMELHAIMTQVGMLKTHVHVHWFANGVAELADSWALAEEASDMVQGLNNGAIFSTEGVYQNKTATMATMTAYNVTTEGLPVHNDLRKYGEHSMLHKMSVKARLALYEVLPQVPRIQIEALVAATLMHSADHYYAGTSLSYLSRSELLQCDFTLARSTVMSPNRYRTRKLLCREHLDDPVCRALYLSAVCVDPEFANGYLFLAVAN